MPEPTIILLQVNDELCEAAEALEQWLDTFSATKLGESRELVRKALHRINCEIKEVNAA